MYKNILLMLMIFTCGKNVIAQDLFISNLDSSINKCYPKILNAFIQQEIRQSEVTKNKAPFDTRLNSDVTQRDGNTYDTSYQKIAIEKRFYDSPITAYTGFDISNGYTPQYDSSQITSSQGREFVGLKLNLLSGFAIDKERLELYNSILDSDKARYEIELSKLLVKTDAIKAYMAWIISGAELKAYERLLVIAEKRQKALTKRFKQGDVSKISLTENYNYVLTRKIKVMAAKDYFNKTSLDLSMFYRDSNCEIETPNENFLPDELPKYKSLPNLDDTEEINAAIRNRPEFKVIETQLEQIRKEQEYAKTALLPKLEINLKYNQNNSPAATTNYFSINQQEAVVTANFSMPLERSYGKGLSSAASQKMTKLLNERKFLVDQVATKIKALHYTVNNTAERITLAESEYALSEKLVMAENQKINNGDSNFFMLNAREENMTNSYLSYLTGLYENYKADIEYNFLNGKNVNLNNM
ncbi:MAG: TolC family protein [Burkholderiales bacterium]|nr:TolC family protein [Burkholderiales bacterium]